MGLKILHFSHFSKSILGIIFHLVCDLTSKTKIKTIKKKEKTEWYDSWLNPYARQQCSTRDSLSVRQSVGPSVRHGHVLMTAAITGNFPQFSFPTSKNKAKDFKFDRSGSWQKKLALMFQTLIYRIDIWEIEINVPSQRKGLNFGGLFPNELKNASGNKQGNTYKSRAWNR